MTWRAIYFFFLKKKNLGGFFPAQLYLISAAAFRVLSFLCSPLCEFLSFRRATQQLLSDTNKTPSSQDIIKSEQIKKARKQDIKQRAKPKQFSSQTLSNQTQKKGGGENGDGQTQSGTKGKENMTEGRRMGVIQEKHRLETCEQ